MFFNARQPHEIHVSHGRYDTKALTCNDTRKCDDPVRQRLIRLESIDSNRLSTHSTDRHLIIFCFALASRLSISPLASFSSELFHHDDGDGLSRPSPRGATAIPCKSGLRCIAFCRLGMGLLIIVGR